jgi:hypothetical protein
MAYVDLNRRFCDLTKAELESPELLAFLGDRSWMQSDGWTELLQYPRVLLLAEAGSGKTEEMREQATRLKSEGKPAFYIALESLDREHLEELLSAEDERIFRAWKAEGQTTAWFFLDAVDELKLTHGKLERTLNRFAKAIDGSLHRTYVVISCRPYDWRPSLDLAIVQEKLPFTPEQSFAHTDSDELFLTALREREGNRRTERKARTIDAGLRAVALLPLSERQIVVLAESLGITDTAALVAEIERRDAWTFARRPLDLVELVTLWKEHGRIGTRTEQHAANVTVKLRDDPSRRDRGVLSDECARLGSERLALGLTLTHTRTIRSPEQTLDTERATGVLDPARLLPDWTEEERQTLLRRGLFDPATYGRVRFHHRSVQEYLAAQRLRKLRERGMSTNSLRRVLFTERYGLQLVIPSMQPIAAWLALWDDDVRRELMAREPETLLSMGDPESLPIGARSQILRAFAVAYGGGGWRGFDIPRDEVRRLAHPEMAGVIRDIWTAAPASPDVKELLLELIWQGSIESCVDIARLAAFDIGLSDSLRVSAIRAIVACGKPRILQEICDSLICDPSKWPNRVIHAVADDLFPGALSVAQLIALIQRAREPKKSEGGFSWALRNIVEAIEPLSDLAIELCDLMADLIWKGRQEDHDWYEPRGLFDTYAPALARLCDRQLEATGSLAAPDVQLIRSSIIANRFAGSRGDSGELVKGLRKHFSSNLKLRELAFWQQVKLISITVQAENPNERYFRTEYGSLIEPLTADDRAWLMGALRNSGDAEHRLIALYALLRLWRSRGREQTELDELVAAIDDEEHLKGVLRKESRPPEPDRDHEDWQQKARQRKLEHEEEERKRIDTWLQWKQELIADPEKAFAAEELGATLNNLYSWLEVNQGSRSRYNVWDLKALVAAFNEDIAHRAAKAFQGVWRAHRPILWSQRSAENRNSSSSVLAEGLTGLASESADPGWATRLTLDEAQLAAVYATVEMNGFSRWLEDLAEAYPAVVSEVIGAELSSELVTDEDHHPALQNLTHANISIKRLLTPVLLARLSDWPSVFRDEAYSRRSAHYLRQVLGILGDVAEGQDRVIAARECARHLSIAPGGPLAITWLQGLFRFDPELATQMLEDKLASLPDKERSSQAIVVFANLFGNRDALLTFQDEGRRASSLGRLVRCAYRYISPVEDNEHEGAYTPGIRDNAENARNFLLGALLETPGHEAQKVIGDLAVDPIFAHFPDRLRLLGRRRAARDAEFAALSPEEVLALERQFEAPPHDRDGLFAVMVSRLDDIAIDIAHDDFTDRSTLRTIQKESEMQRTLARRLRDAAKGAYTVSREDEVADLKRTDIRLTAIRGDQKAVIEVKIADERWSLTELEQALRIQLVGQYLRHDSCRAGCLLLTYDGKKDYWIDPGTKERLSFARVVDYLRRSAQSIEQELGYKVRLAVQSVDLTDPSLGPVQQ